MKKSQTFPWVKPSSTSIMVLLLVCGCQSSTSSNLHHETLSGDNHTRTAFCGTLPNVSSRFNVTGVLTSPVNPNSSIFLFVAQDTSFETSLHVVENCSPIIVRPIIEKINFAFDDLPPGDYVAMVPSAVFFANIQGFPIVQEFNRSGYSLKFNFYGGHQKYSVVSFSIHPPLETQKPKNNYS